MLDCLVLAAGASRRFGRCKLLAQWHGKALLHHVLETARALNPQTLTVITGAFTEAIGQHPWASEVRFRHCDAWQEGMGSSLAFGVKALPEDLPLLVLLGDQPLITTADLRRLLSAWSLDTSRIACASFADTRGVPAVFPAAVKPQLSTLRGERGAKALLTASQVLTVPMPNAALDIDTPIDLLHLTQGNYHDFAQD